MKTLAAVLGVALLAGACQQGSIGGSNQVRDPSGPGNAPGGPGSPGGGSGGPGPGGGSAPGGPSQPGGGTPPLNLPDAGADTSPATTPADAGGETSEPQVTRCQVTITALNPPRFDNLLTGATSRLRVQARVTGTLAPATPTWQWQVQLGSLSEVAVTKLSPEGDIVEFPLASEGVYTIRASAGPMCAGQASAGTTRPSDRMTSYWARVTPPRTSGLPTHDSLITIGGTTGSNRTIALSPGVTVNIDPKYANLDAIRSYIRISSRASSVRFEGNNLSNPFRVDLLSGRTYDVLIVPVGTEAPVLLSGLTANKLQAEPFVFDEGYAVTGTVQRTQAGGAQPVTDARVFLRAEALPPSSIGQSIADGSFNLKARAGKFQVSVLPPVSAGLPEARSPGGTVLVPVQASMVQLTYAAVQTGAVAVTVRSSDGQRPIADAQVRLDADAASLGAVGSFRVGDGPELAAVGAMRAEAKTDSAGSVNFARLPYGRYRALVAPPAGMADAATTVATIEVKAAVTPATVTLARPVKLTGKLLPPSLSQGLKLLAIEAEGPTPGEALAATVDAAGQFTLSVAPGRTYRLQIEPAQHIKLPRLFLGPHAVGMADSSYGEVTLFEGVPIVVELKNGALAVPDAVVQIFCTGAAPDCMDENTPQLEAVRPLAETRADADGRFRVYLPDPARWDL